MISHVQSTVDHAKREAVRPPPTRAQDSARPRQKAFQALPTEYDEDPAWALTATFVCENFDHCSAHADNDRRSSHSFGSSDGW